MASSNPIEGCPLIQKERGIMFTIIIEPNNYPDEVGRFLMENFFDYLKVRDDVDELDKVFILEHDDSIRKIKVKGYKKTIQGQTIVMLCDLNQTNFIQFHLPTGGYVISDNYDYWEYRKEGDV